MSIYIPVFGGRVFIPYELIPHVHAIVAELLGGSVLWSTDAGHDVKVLLVLSGCESIIEVVWPHRVEAMHEIR
ncbi:hypothetical protein RA263_30160, partial [Pseudomonas syringae pv. tagetis]|uniref:hypothetical protein n=1 Tax=Pseudomonas syringae group genomosp. 7 TaxID=251699 RepID=UPI00376F9544